MTNRLSSVPNVTLLALVTAMLVAGGILVARPAAAQVTLDLHALDQVPGQSNAPAKPSPRRRPAHPQPHHAPATEAHAHAPSTTARRTPEKPSEQAPEVTPSPAPPVANAPAQQPSPGTPAGAPPPPAAVIPSGPPPATVNLAPLAPNPPPQPLAPPPPPPVSAEAGGDASPIPGGLRVVFAEGRADLSPATDEALKRFASRAPKSQTTSVSVDAYATATPDDPSTSRRLSLSRALAVRSVLIAQGFDSSRIYVRALGPGKAPEAASTGQETPTDRVDVTVAGLQASGTAPTK